MTTKYALLAIVLSTLIGCSNPDTPDSYFPLQSGLEWQYKIQKKKPDGAVELENYSVKNEGSGKFDDKDIHIRRTSNGTDYYLEKRSDGVYRIAKRIITQPNAVADKPARKILPTLDSETSNLIWNATTAAYAIHRTHPYESMVNKNIHIEMAYSIEARDETVAVPAGRFEHCIRVEGTAEISLYTDPAAGYRDIELTTTEWYAPGVGLVKLIRNEPLNTDVFKGGTVTMELLEFGT